ncbi:MAG TPA: alkaline phosphatase family protein [Solirubrobacteraceae bacterium]|jgi:hypothetical protein|nr:alkaline phosphatase family protein [Solirubrobacteraceae bacterium]
MPAPAKLVLVVIDGMKPAMLERAAHSGQAPTLAMLMQRGMYSDQCVAAYPSVTPVCAATIATGVGPDRHRIPAMNWYHREEARYVEYGSSLSASRRFGISRQLIDTVYNMNRAHLSPDVETVFEMLDDADLRTAGTTYLMYRGRHRHEVARDTALSLLASTVMRHPVMGPREFFYADIFASRRTGCRSQLGMPGVRDRHTGCVGAHLVEHQLFDFLLFSLPDNDAYSHRNGPHAQVASISEADRQLERLVHAGGGPDDFLSDHAVIVMADHSHASVEQAIELHELFGEFSVLAPSGRRAGDAEIALCPSQRSAMVYALEARGHSELVPRIVECALSSSGVDMVMWRDGASAVIARGDARLHFAPGGDVSDLRGQRWLVQGELDVIDGRLEEGRLYCEAYPDALARVWSALNCPNAGEVLLSAAPGYEFADWGGVAHVGGGAHGSLHRSDSLAPLIVTGIPDPRPPGGEQWSIADIQPLIGAHFGLGEDGT